MRSIEMSARTVEAAVEAACEALGVSRDDLNVSYEVLEFPARKFFKTIPAKVRVTVEEPEAETVQPAAPAPERPPPRPLRPKPPPPRRRKRRLPPPPKRRPRPATRRNPSTSPQTRACRPPLIT